jgi:hypothetical protein
MAMGETSMIPASRTQVPAEGVTHRLIVQQGQASVSSEYISDEASMFPVRVKTSQAQVLVRVDIALLRRQQEIEEANKEIRRRLRGG